MGKIYCIMGKSSSGKDSLYKLLLEDERLHLKRIVPYTTRPIRIGEKNGEEYFFVDEDKLSHLIKNNKIIELREYQTIFGIWKYFTVDDGKIGRNSSNFITIGTLESYQKMLSYFDENVMIPIYVEVEDGIRLHRALEREECQENPKYQEMCRRFLADEVDFSEDNLKRAGIVNRFYNEKLEDTKEDIASYILQRPQE